MVLSTAVALVAALPAQAMAADPVRPGKAAQGWSADSPTAKGGDGPEGAIPAQRRASVQGSGYAASKDVAWTTSGDAEGFHLLVADAANGYEWKTAATLSEPGFDADAWIGNACVTESGKRAAVAYAPRTFTNKPELMVRGAFTAVVDLETGQVTKLPHQASLAYFSPGCGEGEDAVFSQLSYDGDKKTGTRLITVDAVAGKAGKPLLLDGQVTSAVPTPQGIVAAEGGRLVRVGKDGKRKTIARTHGVPFQLRADKDGGVTFIERTPGPAAAKTSSEGDSRARRVTAGQIKNGGATPATLVSGALTQWDLASSADGTVYVTGKAKSLGALPGSVRNRGDLAKDARISTRGEAAVGSAWAPGKNSPLIAADEGEARPVRTELRLMGTGKTEVLEAVPGGKPLGDVKQRSSGNAMSPALPGGGSASSTPKAPKTDPSSKTAGSSKTAASKTSATASAAAGSPSDPVESERTCAVPRNDIRKQAFQPTPRQVEWAVDQAVAGTLNKQVSRPANWKNMGMPAYQPQSLFPLHLMYGDTNGIPDRVADWHIPSQILLGITAQESNMWQATRFAVPGVTANSLIGNYYGVKYSADGSQADPWSINWAKADCGYGITQVTDGMRVSDQGVTLSKTQQEAIALDYTANIAAGANILVEKWNQTSKAGLTVNNGHPKWIENWFFALWAYNAGFYEKGGDPSGGDDHWGVGFTNNPANPLWKFNRTPFLEKADGSDDYSHAANPQHWPYQEKVIGWAARPIAALFTPGDIKAGYVAAWWNNNFDRTLVKPPLDLFCTMENNDCYSGRIGENDSNDQGQGACTLDYGNSDTNPHWLHCWWNTSVQWKDCVLMAQCGNAVHRFNDTYPEQPDANSYPPQCGLGTLPLGAQIVEDIPYGATPAGSTARTCGGSTSAGTFDFQFTDWQGTYPGKMDLHQIGAGDNNHFWFSHTRDSSTYDGARLLITGKWTLNESNIGWSRVLVHMPDHGAHTRQAAYVVGGTDSTSKVRVVPQRTRENRWVSLGVFNFTGRPTVSLSTHTGDGGNGEDVAWDSVAFQKLPGKPKDQIVAMGDSFSSGEGASEGNANYYKETNYRDSQDETTRNACHRSDKAWSRQAKARTGAFESIGEQADRWDPAMDYHLIACSGARTYNVLRDPENGELAQIQKGYLDQNTTMVTMSIGGNDSRFTFVVQKCLLAFGSGSCQDKPFDDHNAQIDRDINGDGNIEKDRDLPYQGLPMSTALPLLITEVVKTDILAAVELIHQKAPNAKILLMGYPKLISNDASCLRLGPLGLSKESNDWLNTVAAHLTNEMRDVGVIGRSKGIDIRFSDPTWAFENKGVCGDPEKIHGMVKTLVESDNTLKDWPLLKSYGLSAQSFHPKIAGARAYADAMEATVDGW
ncbi:GDSL-type esterase/lipase family protein [Streptomyces sp. NBC_00572]|uniref:GDSL-type esterase/lipase family protein n=1 Tax=Streptomyces sp. NBC_00572 TaxID=2903664 RepID=UPI002258328B|nr:GDSL-type esterase/lipase family protein [Streptomyces sp. NBC_00572]MCX4981477.1 GDSL-type esterase/lipase family protein [Streptomyces sp. NBC_00572]